MEPEFDCGHGHKYIVRAMEISFCFKMFHVFIVTDKNTSFGTG